MSFEILNPSMRSDPDTVSIAVRTTRVDGRRARLEIRVGASLRHELAWKPHDRADIGWGKDEDFGWVRIARSDGRTGVRLASFGQRVDSSLRIETAEVPSWLTMDAHKMEVVPEARVERGVLLFRLPGWIFCSDARSENSGKAPHPSSGVTLPPDRLRAPPAAIGTARRESAIKDLHHVPQHFKKVGTASFYLVQQGIKIERATSSPMIPLSHAIDVTTKGYTVKGAFYSPDEVIEMANRLYAERQQRSKRA